MPQEKRVEARGSPAPPADRCEVLQLNTAGIKKAAV